MNTFYNILSNDELEHIRRMAEFETTGDRIDVSVPKYQSLANQHLKYAHDPIFSKLCEIMLNNVSAICNKEIVIAKMWFNATRPESNYEWHTHPGYTVPTTIFYLSGCENNGTYFRQGNTVLQVQIEKDNTLLVFDGLSEHTTPNWTGLERYTIAADFKEVSNKKKTIDFSL